MKKLLILLTLCCTVMTAKASLITLDIEDKSYGLNDTLTANIYINDINDGFQQLISGFSFELTHTENRLAFEQVRFGNKLDVDSLFGLPSERRVTPLANSVIINEFSFADQFDLLLAQNGLDRFLLASVDFTVSGLGLVALDLINFSVADEFGNTYSDVRAQGANVQLGAVDVPEPSALAMFALAIMLLLGKRLRKS